ncbi:MAG: hypothetical protein KF716_26600 [Anaerolineae bacterium]|nr:hypothetical protein [Anaerolineae bacterium]
MISSNENKLYNQLQDMIIRHIEEVSRYIVIGKIAVDQVPQEIVDSLEQLDDLCNLSPKHASYLEYETIRFHLGCLETFFQHMNQPLDLHFQHTPVGRIWWRAKMWNEQATKIVIDVPIRTVWQILEPAVPDCLHALGNGLFEARWWKPVPMMDVEIISRTEGLLMMGDPFEPADLPNGIAVRFSVLESNNSPYHH